jgi:hypothetical protein
MFRLARILMLWMLIVSLPVQGIAGAITLPCTMAHGDAAESTAAQEDQCDDPDMSMQAEHSTAAKSAAGVTSQADAPCEKCTHKQHSSCRACTGCGVGASAPPPFAAAGSPQAHFANVYINPTSSFTGWIPSRIERPPRL